MEKLRTILHCDCNNYFASVECIARPELRDVPIAVASDTDGIHGIIVAKNQLAKKYGIVTAEPVISARRKCPNLLLVHPHHDKYEEYCKRINDIYNDYTDQVEIFSIDESWLDITGSLHLFCGQKLGEVYDPELTIGKKIADDLRKRVREELGITISVGVSFNKIFAKLGSDYKKPDATTVVAPSNYKTILYPLPVEAMLFVGKTTAEVLRKNYVTTIGEIAQTGKEQLVHILGKFGESLWANVNGLDNETVRHPGEGEPIKSVGNSITFSRNLQGWDDISAGIMMLADSVGARLRHYGLKCQTVSVQIKNPSLKTISRQMPVSGSTNLTKEIYSVGMEIMKRSWSPSMPIRMLSVTGMHLSNLADCEQINMFIEDTKTKKKQEKLELAMDKIRRRYGHDALSYGSLLKTDITGDVNKEE